MRPKKLHAANRRLDAVGKVGKAVQNVATSTQGLKCLAHHHGDVAKLLQLPGRRLETLTRPNPIRLEHRYHHLSIYKSKGEGTLKEKIGKEPTMK